MLLSLTNITLTDKTLTSIDHLTKSKIKIASRKIKFY